MLVTVGLPFASASATLPLAIRSVFAQTHTDWELLLLEDGSQDGSAELLARIQDPRVHLVRDPVNRGLAARLNQVSILARGKYVARMDADDAMHPDRLRRQLAFLESRPDIDFVSTAAYVIDGANRVCGLKSTEPAPHDPRAALDHSCWIHPTAFARTSWFLANPYDEHLRRSQDYDLWARVYDRSSFAKLPEPLLFYREVGVFSIPNYLATKHADVRIIRRHGPAIIGRARTELLVLQCRLKAGIYMAMWVLHAEHFLVERRSAPIADAEAVAAEEMLRALEATPVPGWGVVP